ncbi:MAG: lamin tail domain-containing protein, partial [Anaerolineae bacterium]
HVLISAVLYDGYQSGDTDEAIQLLNVGDAPADLDGWELCKDTGSNLSCRALPATVLSPTTRIWLARKATSFTVSFGFPPNYEMDRWLSSGLSNTGDEVILRNDLGNVVDALVYEGGNTDIIGWNNENGTVQPYSVGREEGQILYRIPDEVTGLPITDTDTAADWIQYSANVTRGRRVLYPGWDLDLLFWPLTATEAATVVVGITPDNGFDVLSQTIARAQRTISVEVYSLRNPDIVVALAQKAQAGVNVTVLLEGGQAGVSRSDPRWQQELWACRQIEAAGGQCWFMIHETGDGIFNRYDYLHAKFIIVDDEWLVIGSQNLTEGSMPSDDKSNGTSGSRGVVLATNAPSVVARAAEVFARDLDPVHHNDILRWNTAYTNKYGLPDPAYTPVLTVPDHVTYTIRFPDPLTVSGTFDLELFTAPETALRQSDALLGLVKRAGAGDTVYVEQLYEHVDWGANPANDPNLRLEAYIDAARRDARVRILLNGGTFDQPFFQNTNTNTVAYVNQIASAEGLDLQAAIGDPTGYGIHSKMVLVWLEGEGGYSHVGSINGSEGSSKINREIALQIRSDEVYHYLARVFETDWWLAHPVFLPLLLRDYAPPEAPVDYVVISEVMVRPYVGDPPGNREWVELYNPTNHPIDLSNWSLGDAQAPKEYGSGTYRFPAGTEIPAQTTIVVAQQTADVTFTPDFEFVIDPGRDDPAVPNMNPAGAWDGFGLMLGNGGDEVILRDHTGADVDIVVWDDPADDPIVKGNYPGVTPWLGMLTSDWSLERRPPYYDSDDCSADFFPRYPATPGSVPLP